MSAQSGVPMADLRCPTCSRPFESVVHRDDDYEFVVNPNEIKRLEPSYLVCRAGHKWTIKTRTAVQHPSKVRSLQRDHDRTSRPGA